MNLNPGAHVCFLYGPDEATGYTRFITGRVKSLHGDTVRVEAGNGKVWTVALDAVRPWPSHGADDRTRTVRAAEASDADRAFWLQLCNDYSPRERNTLTKLADASMVDGDE